MKKDHSHQSVYFIDALVNYARVIHSMNLISWISDQAALSFLLLKKPYKEKTFMTYYESVS